MCTHGSAEPGAACAEGGCSTGCECSSSRTGAWILPQKHGSDWACSLKRNKTLAVTCSDGCVSPSGSRRGRGGAVRPTGLGAPAAAEGPGGAHGAAEDHGRRRPGGEAWAGRGPGRLRVRPRLPHRLRHLRPAHRCELGVIALRQAALGRLWRRSPAVSYLGLVIPSGWSPTAATCLRSD